jgi:glycosyltransferase involved in cell wall biosynthesis
LIEAMAVGLPFVSTNVGAVADLAVGDLHKLPGGLGLQAGNGFLTERTADALYYSIGELISNPYLAQQMGAAGRDFVMARFASDRLIEELTILYLGLLNKSGSATMPEADILPEPEPQRNAVAAGFEHEQES